MMAQGFPIISGFDRLLEYIEDITGITVPDTNYRALAEEVKIRTLEMGVTVQRYIDILRDDSAERESFLNAVTINETYFFRESRHFTVLREILLPRIGRTGGPVLAWSATCATGEEGISLALILKDYFGDDTRSRFTVYATDLNSEALSHMRQGIYTKNSFREDGKAYHRLIEQHSTMTGKSRKISADIIAGINIARRNLFLDTLEDMPDSFHIVFLRNTLIYMKGEKKNSILARVVSKISEGGYLFLSSSEMPLVVHPDLETVQEGDIYFFRKKKHPHREISSIPVNTPAGAKPPAHRIGRKNIVPLNRSTSHRQSSVSVASVLAAVRDIERHKGRDSISDNQSYIIAELLLYSIHFINNMKLDIAREIVRTVVKHFSNEITSHLLGFIALLEGERDAATSFFSAAITCNTSFWPSRFYLANTLRDSKPLEALKEFTKCREILSRSDASQDVRYGFLVEYFSEKYFLDLCDSWIQSLEKVSQRQQSGVKPCR
ncbi:MAG TPA: CheR family methyltransferase [Spirochaetota bacterium]|nr:CheR family methyltransferase [Spirochaetota bacterium]